MWDSKETIIPEKQTGRKPEKNLSFTSKFGSPDWTMLITSLNSFSRVFVLDFSVAFPIEFIIALRKIRFFFSLSS
jgi:hypothetical protein